MSKHKFRGVGIWLASIASIFLLGCSEPEVESVKATQPKAEVVQEKPVVSIETNLFSLQFNGQLHSQIIPKDSSAARIYNTYVPSEYIELGRQKTKEEIELTAHMQVDKVDENELKVKDFTFKEATQAEVNDEFGQGISYQIVGESSVGIQKQLSINIYNNFPTLAIYKATYKNNTDKNIVIKKWVNNAIKIDAIESKQQASGVDEPYFWAYNGSTHKAHSHDPVRYDWLFPVTEGFSRDNYLGMNASDYGSGTPVTDIWRRDIGVAIGMIEPEPKLISLPMAFENKASSASMHVEFEANKVLASGESLETFNTFVSLHAGDFYSTLGAYGGLLAAQGLEMPAAPDSAYEPVWCAWGYDRNFTPEEVLNTLPKVKEVGFEWAVLDDGWQEAEGDWNPIASKYPDGDASMKAFVDEILAADLKPKLWWAPLAADPGSDLLHDHSDMLLLDENGAVHDVTWWNSFYLCPAYDKTVEHSVELVKKFMSEWGYQGLKIDGQHLNGVPPCYNPAHNHAYPEESVEKLQEFWKAIYDTAMEINPNSVVEICPCGTNYSPFYMPYMNQSVSSDPVTAWQVRQKGKVLKAISGDKYPYYGDHVEQVTDDEDFAFATSVGIGAVIGSKFAIAEEGSTNQFAIDAHLTPEKEVLWKKWVNIYNDKMLPKGEYMGGLYDLGFDRPESHAIKKDGAMFYAFYADDFTGKVELRGLGDKNYKVVDYVNDKDYGTHNGSNLMLDVKFAKFILLEVRATP